MEKEQYDIIFLDIMLPQMDGVELFENRPLNFLIKPLDEKKIQKVLELFLKLNGGMETIFSYRKRGSSFKIELSKIL